MVFPRIAGEQLQQKRQVCFHTVVLVQADDTRALYQTVQQRAGMRPRFCIVKKPVLAPNDERLHRPLRTLIVDTQPPVFQVAHQLWPLLLTVTNYLAQMILPA